VWGVYKQVAAQIGRACPALVLALPVAIATYVVWPRTRYFGNTAPLLVSVLFLILGMAHPHVAGAGFLIAAVPFLFIFVSGVLADLLETRSRTLVTACVLGMLGAYVAWDLLNLAQVPVG
jgi:predicted membrane protein